MIASAWTYIAVILICAGIFPFLEKRISWRIFSILPPIVLTYLMVTALSVMGLWQLNTEIQASQKLILGWLLPALMFLLLVNCDFKAILALGPRILGGFICAMLSILTSIALIFWLLQSRLPNDAWQTLAAVGGGWIGGTANLVAVSQALQASPNALSNALLVDALCYSVWVLVLFASVPLQLRFNRFSKAPAMADQITARFAKDTTVRPEEKPMDIGLALLWLGVALAVGNSASAIAELLPKSEVLTSASWSLLLATLFGIAASYTPLRQLSGSMTLASSLLAVVVATIASKASFSGISSAPWFLLAGMMILVLHGMLMILAAKLFRFDLSLCGIASLSCVGGVATAPLLAAAYSPVLAPVGILLAMLGYALGTGGGLLLAGLLKPFGA